MPRKVMNSILRMELRARSLEFSTHSARRGPQILFLPPGPPKLSAAPEKSKEKE